VSTNDRDVLRCRICAFDLRNESGSTNNIEGSDTEESLGVVDALALKDLSDDGNSGVDLSIWSALSIVILNVPYRVGNDEDVGIGCSICGSLG
jgi:hypothetical protein